MFAIPPLSSQPIDVAARRFYLRTVDAQPESVLIHWLLRETDAEIFGELWEALEQRHGQAVA